jgi:hypothetical protein
LRPLQEQCNDFQTLDLNHCDKVYHYLNNFNEEYVMWVNGCFPFLKEDTIIEIANYFKNSNLYGLHCVKKVYNWKSKYKIDEGLEKCIFMANKILKIK